MVNVGTGNALLQDDDMSVPHKGIAMAFRRTYNSQSPPTFSGDLQTYTTMYGNGWTNTFDAHLVRTSPGHFSVFDIDGARYDFTPYAPGVAIGPPGQPTKLVWDGACGITWTKKSGTVYYFYNVQPEQPGCPQMGTMGGYAGRLYQIIGRNRNTYITFSYAWDNGDASVNGKVSSITATTESGMTAMLNFADVNGRRLLQTLTFPDSATSVSYGYDSLGDLTTVSRPPNNASGNRPLQIFQYQTLGSDSVLSVASSPRWDGPGDGGYLAFAFAGSGAVSSTVSAIAHVGVMNPTPGDGTNSVLQPGSPTGPVFYRTDYYTTGVTTPTYRDTDGRMTNWVVDSVGRPTQTQECTASVNQGQQCTGMWLVSNESWDANNNVISEVDPRGNETNYAYDANDNTIAVAKPAPASGGFRPTALYSYDALNNVTAYCDPVTTHLSVPNGDWTTAPPASDTLCPLSAVATQIQWSYPSYQPYGELAALTTPGTAAAPSGYQRTVSYDASRQGGTDFGLPTTVSGSPVSQSIDGSTPSRQPKQNFWYDASGNITCYGTGAGQWLLAYDSLNRLVRTADPDDSASGTGSCGKSGAQPGWNTAMTTAYFADGSVSSKQSASQAASGVATSFTYDLDGNEITEQHHYGCVSTSSCTTGVTNKWYDGADRLVEVQLPYDGWDIQGYPWSTRYIYDISQGSTTPYAGLSLQGYGNLVATKELLSGTVWQPAYGVVYPMSSGTWSDVRATSFDGLDRPVNSYEAAFGAAPKEANSYDGPGQNGLLSSMRRATGEIANYSYDLDGRHTGVSYQNDAGVTPALQFVYDADDRIVSQSSSALGAETFTYDQAGEMTANTEPATLGGGTISYGYYADGLRSNVGYSDSTQSFPMALSYAYRADGRREQLLLANGKAFTWAYTSAGREMTQTDPLTGSAVSPDATNHATKLEKPYYPASITYGPWTKSYDSYGRTSSIVLPVSLFQYSYSTAQYDLEDQIAEQTTTASGVNTGGSTSRCIASNVRNEKIAARWTSPCANQPAIPQLPNGTVATLSSFCANGAGQSGCPAAQDWTVDARSGMLLQDNMTGPYSNAVLGPSYTYDASGRLTQDSEARQDSFMYNATNMPQPSGPAQWCPVSWLSQNTQSMTCLTNGTRQKAYDAENRLRSETFSWANDQQPTAESYGAANIGGYWEETSGYSPDVPKQPTTIQSVDYSPSSHPMRLALYHPDYYYNTNIQYATRAWLWDDNDRFLECRLGGPSGTACQSPWLSIEGLGDYDPVHGTVIRVNDRNIYGAVVMNRTSAFFSSWTEAPTSPWNRTQVAPCSTEDNPTLYDVDGVMYGACDRQHDGKLSADGWSLDYETWQGVRSFDPAVGQWNTPDAYAGEVHDPMSQKPYMWNRNNPYMYSDPSGYAPYTGGACSFAVGCVAELLIDVAERAPEDRGWSWGSPSRGDVVYPFSAQSRRQIQHIFDHHLPGGPKAMRSDGTMRSLFNAGTTAPAIRQLVIQSVFSPDHDEKKEGDRTVFELNVGHVIGLDENGHKSSTIRSAWDPNGNLISAYPIPDKK